jgi:hypothetical protein
VLFLSGSTPYIGIEMTAVDRPKIGAVDNVTLITPQGNILYKYSPNFASGFEENFVLSTEDFRLPNESFYIRLEGLDSGMK